ncbi:MAG: Histidine kinase [Chthoniobacter sp.]|nr:Histidine kinase [Chthoniobacter sp.]
MTVQKKIGLLLLGVIAIFGAGLSAIKEYEKKRFGAVAAEQNRERQASFDKFIQEWTQPLGTFVEYFSVWSAMVDAIERPNRTWVEENLHDHTLASYRAQFAWAYNAAGAIVFTRTTSVPLPEVPLPSGGVREIFANRRTCHFFVQTDLGLLEVRGATVHPSSDAGGSKPPRGYFFAARRWTAAELKEVGVFTGNEVRFLEPGEQFEERDGSDRSPEVSFARPLPGLDGRPAATIIVSDHSPLVERLNRSSQLLFWALLAFALLLSLVLFVSLSSLVSRPLEKLGRALREQNTDGLEDLQTQSGEFGDFARMMSAFYEQRENLLREMAERRQTEEALQESEDRLRHSQKMEAVGRLAGGIAHDFNNLLTAIIGYAELIALATSDEAIQTEAELIRKAGEQAADLTRQLLAFSRKQLLQPRVLDFNALVLNMEKLLHRVIGEHIELCVETEAVEARVRADPTQLEQVIINLGVNARDAMPSGGVLTMRTANTSVSQTFHDSAGPVPAGNYVTLTLQDTGCGMDEQTKQRIFEPFFTTKNPGKGTGLGLATVYGIVQQSGGAIVVDSRKGEGTRFTIYLPQEDAPVEALPERPQLSAKRCRAETVMVVEDEEIVRQLVCAVLSEQGYEVLCAPSGAEGLRMAHNYAGKIDLLVTDIIMPQMNGPEVARTLRLERPHVRVLFVSGYSDNDIGDHGILAPELRFLEKPFTPEVLCRKVREVLDESAQATN